MFDSRVSLPLLTESHYRQIVQSAVDYAIIASDLQGRITSWNEGARRVLGWSEEEMRGQPVHRFFAPEDVAAGAVEREMETAHVRGSANDERWHMRKTGERFWASGLLMPLRNEKSGEIIGYVKILRDRTEQRAQDARLKELNETLVASEARLQMALDVGGMGFWQCDLQSLAVQWWPGVEVIHGLPERSEPMHIAQYLSLVHPDDRDRVEATARDAVANKSGRQVEYRVVWPDGSVRWLEVRSKLLMDLEGQAWRLSGVCLDITQRKRVESDLKFVAEASAELADLSDYQTTLDKIAHLAVPHFADWCNVDMLTDAGTLKRVAIAHVDAQKEAQAREIDRRYPHHPDSVTAAGPFHVLRTGQSQRVVDMTDEILERSITDPEHRTALRALGLRSYLAVPLAVRGKVLGVLGFISAESGRRYTAEDQLLAEDVGRRAAVAIENAALMRAMRDSDRAKDVFLATLAHELRNPLAPVWNGLSIIKRVPQDTERVLQVAGMIERQVAQLARLVDDLLDVSRITTGKIELQKQRCDLAAVIHSAVETSRPHLESARHKLTLRLPDEPVELLADPVRLAQVFANLLNNAAKFTLPDGAIVVEVTAEPELVKVCVRDNGIGIAADMLGKVFALFTQVTHPSQRTQGGLGIGLSLVEGLIRLHGGWVEARSEGLEKGSEFMVYLPRGSSPAAPESGSNEPAQQAVRERPRVLVVDDNYDAAGTLAELLQMMGSEVCVAHEGLQAVTAALQFRPDVVLLDIGLPDINGYEVARRIRASRDIAQPRLVALTGWGQDEDKRLAAQAGFDEHWTKPVDPARLQRLTG